MFPVIAPVESLSPSWFTEQIIASIYLMESINSSQESAQMWLSLATLGFSIDSLYNVMGFWISLRSRRR